MGDDDRGRGPPASRTSRVARWRGLVGLAVARLWTRATRTRSGRLAATTAAVALTIAFLLVVTGVALALADGGIATETDADVRIAPESGASLSAVDGVEGARLGATAERAAAIREADGVAHASPALFEPATLAADDGTERTVLLVGVVPDGDARTVAGLPTDALEPGDPHYADGSYDGRPTNEVVLSTAAAEALGATAGDDLSIAGSAARLADGSAPPPVTVTAVEDAGDRTATAPVALVHLSELQTLSGAAGGDLADQVLAWGDADAAATASEAAYPHAAIQERGDRDPAALFGDGLAFATAALALLVGVTICAAFVATTMGMAVTEDRRTLATLAAVGYPRRGRFAIVAASTLATTCVGAVAGIALGAGGIAAVNALARASFAPGAVAAFDPVFVPYAIGVALASGLVATPYPLAVAARTTVVEEVGR